ncbi:MAG: carboxypeptidase-like regulatory domain-containing protein [Flammeovirgaceae bacterium]|jgi:hypothetical protein|nr:carboxypeptidase-like regulatory domain-containing protein [Flammeovirgaceae bacterium]
MRVGVFLLFMACLQLHAQQFMDGFIFNSAEKIPVEFASIRLKSDPSVGTVSNQDGYFKLTIPTYLTSVDSLEISHVNYNSLTIPVASQAAVSQKFFLKESVIELGEVSVVGKEDLKAFNDIVNATKASLSLPMTCSVYYRELVQGNKEYNKYADALLTVGFDKQGEDRDLVVKVDQCRAFQLPKSEDDKFELVSPVKIELVLGYAFADFLNRFKRENQDFHFYFFKDVQGGGTLLVEPKKEATKVEDRILYRATIKTDANFIIKEVALELDTTSRFEKSLLGLRYGITNSKIFLTFNTSGSKTYLSSARVDFRMKFSTKKFQQVQNFVSEFVVLKSQPVKFETKGSYRKASLYKHGTKFDFEFWKGNNLPIFSEKESELFTKLESQGKVDNSK